MLSPETQIPLQEIEPRERSLIIGLLGAPGSGKTTFAREFSKKCKISHIEEDFSGNPFLPLFYENQQKYAFFNQKYFLEQKITQLLKKGNGRVKVFDPAIQMDYLYALNLHHMEILDKSDWIKYSDLYKTLTEGNNIKKPDIFVAFVTNFIDIEQRIKRRNRPYEQKTLSEHPEYFKNLNYLVHKYALRLRMQENSKCMLINTSYSDIYSNHEAKKEVVNRTGLFITQYLKQIENIGCDGMRITAPEFIKNGS